MGLEALSRAINNPPPGQTKDSMRAYFAGLVESRDKYNRLAKAGDLNNGVVDAYSDLTDKLGPNGKDKLKVTDPLSGTVDFKA